MSGVVQGRFKRQILDRDISKIESNSHFEQDSLYSSLTTCFKDVQRAAYLILTRGNKGTGCTVEYRPGTRVQGVHRV